MTVTVSELMAPDTDVVQVAGLMRNQALPNT
jgi:hypothetical protein